MDPVSALQSLYTVAKMIYTAADGAKGNEMQCKMLKGRVQTLESVLRQNERNEGEINLSALHQLIEVLNSAYQLIQKHSERNFFKQMLLYKNAVDAFAQCNRHISDCVADLNLSLTMNVNTKEDKQAAEEDERRYEKLVDQVKGDKGALQALTHDNSEQVLATMEILQKQFKSPSMEKYLLDAGHLTIDQENGRDVKLGHGGFGIVYLGTYHGTPVAVKEINIHSPSDRENVRREVEILAPLYHENVVRLLGYSVNEASKVVQIVLEYLPKGNLETRIVKGQMTYRDKMQTASQIVSAMVYLHSHHPPLLHRDLKTTNVMYDKHDVVRVIDFGLARAKDGSQYPSQNGITGTTRYCAPELFKSTGTWSRAADVFSYGVLVFRMVTGLIPYHGLTEQAVLAEAINGHMLTEAQKIEDPIFQKMVTACVVVDPKERPSFTFIKANFIPNEYSTIKPPPKRPANRPASASSPSASSTSIAFASSSSDVGTFYTPTRVAPPVPEAGPPAASQSSSQVLVEEVSNNRSLVQAPSIDLVLDATFQEMDSGVSLRRIQDVVIATTLKRETPSKHYVYVINSTRLNGEAVSVCRRYSEFDTLLSKLKVVASACRTIPELPKLPEKKYIGRSSIREVALGRLGVLNEFLQVLVKFPPLVSESKELLDFLTGAESKQPVHAADVDIFHEG